MIIQQKIGLGLLAGAGLGLIAKFLIKDNSNSPAAIAERELSLWDNVKETDPSGLGLVGKYWATIGQQQPINIAWSGAFIQNVIKNSDNPNALFESAAHYYYGAQAVRDKGKPGRYGAYRPSEVKLEPNDIVLTTRGVPIKFDDLKNDPGTFKVSHGDIVTKVRGNSARVIGGNVNNSVFARNFKLDNQGKVIEPNVFAVLRYQKT